MSTFSFQWTHESDIKRWQKILDKGGKLGPKQQQRWDDWHRRQAAGSNSPLDQLAEGIQRFEERRE